MLPLGGKAWIVLMGTCVSSILMPNTFRSSSFLTQKPETIFKDSYTYNATQKCSGGMLRWPTLKRYRNKGNYILEIIEDALRLNANLFTPTSFIIMASSFPPFVASRNFDCKLQNCFYCRKHHKNLNQISDTCETVAKYSISIPIVALGSLAFLSSNEDLRITSWVYLIGMPFVIFGKDILKKVKIEECKRPWNQHFCKHKQSYGGFPSGHMAQATYTAVLYGKRFGKYFAFPLSAIAAYVGTCFLNCNRHYFSQLVAGAALGTMYAFAADKLAESKLEEAGVNVRFGFEKNRPSVKVSYKF